MAQLTMHGDWVAVHLIPLTGKQADYWISQGGAALLNHINTWDGDDPNSDVPADYRIGNRADLSGDFFAGVELNHGSMQLLGSEATGSQVFDLEVYRNLDSYPKPVQQIDEPVPFDGYRLAYVEFGHGQVTYDLPNTDDRSISDLSVGITDALNLEPWAMLLADDGTAVLDPETEGLISKTMAFILDSHITNIAAQSDVHQ